MIKILVCVGDGIGNMIMTTPMISALYQMGAEIDIYGNANYLNGHHLFKNRPEVSAVFDELSDASEYDAVVATVGGYKLIPKISGIKKLAITPSDYKNKSEIENNMEVARQMGWNLDTPDTFCGFDIDYHIDNKYTGLHNGIHNNPIWHRKSYPHFKKLLELIEYPVLFGASNECVKCNNENLISFTGKLNIRQTAGCISQCSAFISTDSGLAHIASALNVPTYIIWGPTSILKNKPPKANIITNKSCEPCQEFYANWEKGGRWASCKTWHCMDIKPEDIIESITSFSNGR